MSAIMQMCINFQFLISSRNHAMCNVSTILFRKKVTDKINTKIKKKKVQLHLRRIKSQINGIDKIKDKLAKLIKNDENHNWQRASLH